MHRKPIVTKPGKPQVPTPPPVDVLEEQFKQQMKLEQEAYLAQKQMAVAIPEEPQTAHSFPIQPKKEFERRGLSNSQFHSMLLDPGSNLQDLFRTIPSPETLDSKTLSLIKQLAFKELINGTAQQEAALALTKVFTVTEEKHEFLADFIECHVDKIARSDRVQFKRRGMFRSKSSVSYMAYTLCILLQSAPETSLFSAFAQILADKAQRQPDAVIFYQILANELAQVISQSHIEIPCAVMLSKVIILNTISLIQDNVVDQHLLVNLVEILGHFLKGTQQALSKLQSLADQKTCYCGEDTQQQLNTCCFCNRQMHGLCTNQAKLCATCQESNFESGLLEFYDQYQSCYTDFSSCIGWLEQNQLHKQLTRARGKSWLSRDLMSPAYARSLLLASGKINLRDLSQALTSQLLLVCHECTNSQVKIKGLKALKSLELSQQLTQLLRVRLQDQSCLIRELCLEMLGVSDIQLLISMAADKSVTVRQKVVQLLSRCLDGEHQASVFIVLYNQKDQSLTQKVVKCLASVLAEKCKHGAKAVIALLKELRSRELWTDVFKTKQGSQVQHLALQICELAAQDLQTIDTIITTWPESFQPIFLPSLSEDLLSLPNQKLTAQILQKVLHYQQDVLFGDELPNSTVAQLQETCLQAIKTCPLINLKSLTGLLCQISEVALLNIGFQSQEILKKPTKDSFQARALLVEAYAVYHLPVEGLQKFKQETNKDFYSSAHQQITDIVLSKSTSAEVFDIALEGIGVIWLKYPQSISLSTVIFTTVINSLLNDQIHAKTRSHILQTLTKFLKANKQDLPSGLADRLTSLTSLCSVPHTKLRQSAFLLVLTLSDQGLTPTSKLVQLSVIGSIDPSPQIRFISTQLLKQLCHQKLQFVSIYLLSISQLLQDCWSHLETVCQLKFDGSLQSDQVYEDRGIFDQLLKTVSDESQQLVKEFKVKLIKAYDSIPNELFYIQLLLTLVDQDNSQSIMILVNTNEQIVYKQLKESCDDVKIQAKAIKLLGLKFYQKLEARNNWRQVSKQLFKIKEVWDEPQLLMQYLRQEVKAKDFKLKQKFRKQFDKINQRRSRESESSEERVKKRPN